MEAQELKWTNKSGGTASGIRSVYVQRVFNRTVVMIFEALLTRARKTASHSSIQCFRAAGFA